MYILQIKEKKQQQKTNRIFLPQSLKLSKLCKKETSWYFPNGQKDYCNKNAIMKGGSLLPDIVTTHIIYIFSFLLIWHFIKHFCFCCLPFLWQFFWWKSRNFPVSKEKELWVQIVMV